MSKSSDKRERLTERILEHIAAHGFASVHHFSRLAKEIRVGRSLLYFYYKSTEEVLTEVGEMFRFLLVTHYRYVVEQELAFKEYMYSLLKIRSLVFFTFECQKECQRIPTLQTHLDLVMETLDSYSFQRFKEHYQVEDQDPEQISFLYSCCRSQWWESLGSYETWSEESVDLFLASLDQLMSAYVHQDAPSS